MTLQAWVEVLPDFSKLNDGNARRGIASALGGAGTVGSTAFGGSFLKGVGAVFGGTALTGLAAGAGRLIGDAIGSAINFGLDGVGLASDLGETRSAVQQVFGEAAADIEAYASKANKALGQTQIQALKGAQNFGVFARAAGLTGKPLSDFSTGLVTLSSDLASFYNTSGDEAIEAIGAGLRGEAEPLRRYGVLLDDATLRQAALNLGIYDGKNALTSQQRVLAAQAEIYRQTGIAQGDFARTSGGLAGQQKILEASLLEAQTALGTALLPAMNSAVTYANSELIPKFLQVVDVIGPKISAALEASAPQFEKLADAAGPLVDTLVEAGVDALPEMISGFQDLVAGAPDAIQFFKDLAQGAKDAEAGLNGTDAALDGVADVVRKVLGDGNGNGVWDDIGPASLFNGDKWKTAFENSLPAVLQGGRDSGLSFNSGLVNGLQQGAGATRDAAVKLADDAAKAAIPTASTGALLTGQSLGDGFAAGIRSRTQAANDAAIAIATSATAAARKALQIKSPSKVFEQIGAYVSEGFAIGVGSNQSMVDSAITSLGSGATMSALGIPTAASSSSAFFPSSVTLLDKDGSILARTEVRADQRDLVQSVNLDGGFVS